MNPHSSQFDKLNQLIQASLNVSNDPIARALEIARVSGAFKQSNVIFFKNQLYPLNPQNPGQSLQQLKALKMQKAG
ncbi:MAG: hypothetical protein BGO77_08170 [Caedibacter sp. 37-49]|nr:MAG: hypothetical protein BGO77_08170 [Caedibacter sp. 37-49]